MEEKGCIPDRLNDLCADAGSLPALAKLSDRLVDKFCTNCGFGPVLARVNRRAIYCQKCSRVTFHCPPE